MRLKNKKTDVVLGLHESAVRYCVPPSSKEIQGRDFDNNCRHKYRYFLSRAKVLFEYTRMQGCFHFHGGLKGSYAVSSFVMNACSIIRENYECFTARAVAMPTGCV